ncbi:MAG: hypothetical protein QOG62_1668 [Thermoleophilaceae bacterium]|jgi:hypothetical protein|nr:hypothetical protein [Thermoleophilaceae bacterium]
MRASELALAQGLRDTHATIAEWRANRWKVLIGWTSLSLAIAITLLLAVAILADKIQPDPTRLEVIGANVVPSLEFVGAILFRNSLVLALHAFACVAGFIAGSSLPMQAERHSGIWRTIHEKAGPLAITFVVCATSFSLITQAYILGSDTSTLTAQLGLPIDSFLLVTATHAIPELTALFLPLAAWIIASRRNQWNKLLAATFVTVGIAIPVLILSAFGEVYFTPHLIQDLIRS